MLCVAGCVAKERINTVGRVVAAGGVAKERIRTVGRVGAAGCVAKERLKTGGRVVAAGCVAKERMKPVAVLSPPVVLLVSAADRWPCCRCRWCCY